MPTVLRVVCAPTELATDWYHKQKISGKAQITNKKHEDPSLSVLCKQGYVTQYLVKDWLSNVFVRVSSVHSAISMQRFPQGICMSAYLVFIRYKAKGILRSMVGAMIRRSIVQ